MSFAVSEQCRLVSNGTSRRIDFLAPGSGVYAIRFFSQPGYEAFMAGSGEGSGTGYTGEDDGRE